MDGLLYSLDDPYYRLGLVHMCLYVRAYQLVTGTSSMFARGSSSAKAPPLAARPVHWNGRGRRLVELTMSVTAEGIPRGCQGK